MNPILVGAGEGDRVRRDGIKRSSSCASHVTDIWTVPAGHSNAEMPMGCGMEHMKCGHAQSSVPGVNGRHSD